jgi:hypothetical protein
VLRYAHNLQNILIFFLSEQALIYRQQINENFSQIALFPYYPMRRPHDKKYDDEVMLLNQLRS